jgi:hypothetical protein
MANAPILFCSDPVRSAAYFLEWKLALTALQVIGVGNDQHGLVITDLLIIQQLNINAHF